MLGARNAISHSRTMPQTDRPQSASTPSLQAADDVIGDLITWRRAGLKAALVTLVGIDGTTPRPLGAQMAVCEDGRYAGYLSGGCFEQTVAKEAQDVIYSGENRLVRYGKGSAYFDLQLPCGSGLDLYFDQSITATLLEQAGRYRDERQAFAISTRLKTGASQIAACTAPTDFVSRRDGDIISRAIIPRVRVLIVGGGPSLAAIATLVAAAGFDIDVASPDDAAASELGASKISVSPLRDAGALDTSHLDRWSAAIVAFHEHDWEAPVLAHILATPCFYIGVLGSRTAQANRLARLAGMGFSSDQLARIRGPVGLIPGAKSRVTLAIGILAELASEAKARGMIA